jgi:predicted TIM-barrel fold metal-dependent hydrolase
MKKIDIHCHTTNRKVPGTIPKSATIEQITKEMESNEVVLTNLLATYFPHKSSGVSNYRLHNWIKDNPKFCMFGSLDFEHYFYQGINELEELTENKLIKGIKIYTCYQEIDLAGKEFNQVVQLAGKYSLPMMFHVGYSYAAKRKYGKISVATLVKPNDLDEIIAENSSVNFILSHMGKPFFDELIDVVKKYDNVYTDMSGLVDSKYDSKLIPGSLEGVRKFLGECGPSRLLFGTDFPVQTYEDSINFIEKGMEGYSVSDKSKVYYENATKLLKFNLEE